MDQDQINDLIYKYESELVKVRYQEEKLNDIIAELRIMKKKSKDSIIENTIEEINTESEENNHVLEEVHNKLEENNHILEEVHNKIEEIITPVENDKTREPIKYDNLDDLIDDNYSPPDWSFENEEEKEKFFKKRNEQLINEANLLKNVSFVVSESKFIKVKNTDIFAEDKNNLSDWDRFLINMIKFSDGMLSNSEIFYMSRIFTDQKNLSLTDDEIKEKIKENMTKLSENPKSGILKYDSPDQGVVYCLSDEFIR